MENVYSRLRAKYGFRYRFRYRCGSAAKETENKKEIVYTEEEGINKPITEKVVMPVIEGAIVTAQGAGNANVKASIVSAVEAVTGLAVHKIQVFEMGIK